MARRICVNTQSFALEPAAICRTAPLPSWQCVVETKASPRATTWCAAMQNCTSGAAGIVPCGTPSLAGAAVLQSTRTLQGISESSAGETWVRLRRAERGTRVRRRARSR
eukprot:3801376-Prymnesium_polylepis.1